MGVALDGPAYPRPSVDPPAPMDARAAVPDSAVGWLRLAQTGDGLEAEMTLIESLRPLGRERWAALFREMSGPGVPEVGGGRIRQSILRLWADEAPEEALEAVKGGAALAEFEIPVLALLARDGTKAETHFSKLLGQAGWAWVTYARWALTHAPERVGQALVAASRPYPRAWAPNVEEVLGEWFRRDEGSALGWIELADPNRQVGYGVAAAVFAREKEPAARRWFETVEVPGGKPHVAGYVALALIRQGRWAEARWWAEKAPDEDFDQGSLARQWASHDRRAAMEWAMGLKPDSRARGAALAGVAEVVAATVSSWEEAQSFLESIPDGATHANVSNQLLARLPPAMAVHHLDEVAAADREAMVYGILCGKPPLPLDEAVTLATREAAHTRLGLSTVAERLSDARGPQAAFEWLAGMNSPDDLAGLVSHWAESDPLAAAEALIEETRTKDRTSAFRNLAGVWAKWDVEAASGWFAALPTGPERDAAAEVIISEMLDSDPAATLGWVAGLTQPQQRRRWLLELAGKLDGPDEARWKDAVERSALSEAERAILTGTRP